MKIKTAGDILTVSPRDGGGGSIHVLVRSRFSKKKNTKNTCGQAIIIVI